MRKLLLVVAALAMTLPASAAGRYFVRGGIGFGPAFGPAFGPWGYWGYPPYAYGGYYYAPSAGEVKLHTDVKDAEVFINGAYAGTAGKLKSMRLRQGAYTVEVRAPGRMRYAERIYVINGKTVHLRPDLRVQPAP